MLLFDTSILIRQQRGDASVEKKLEILSERFPKTPSITFVNLFEYLIGIKQQTKKEDSAMKFLENFIVINTTEKTGELMASLRLKYEKIGIQFSFPDLIIASLAIENELTLVSSDKDFLTIKELKLELIS